MMTRNYWHEQGKNTTFTFLSHRKNVYFVREIYFCFCFFADDEEMKMNAAVNGHPALNPAAAGATFPRPPFASIMERQYGHIFRSLALHQQRMNPPILAQPFGPQGLLAAAAAAAAAAGSHRPNNPPIFPFQASSNFEVNPTHALLSMMRSNVTNKRLLEDKEEEENENSKRVKTEDGENGRLEDEEESVCLRDDQPCSEAAKRVKEWDVNEVVEFVSDIDLCAEYADVFRAHSIDGATLLLLTEAHYADKLGMKLGPMIKFRSELAKAIAACPKCFHCNKCHRENNHDTNADEDAISVTE